MASCSTLTVTELASCSTLTVTELASCSTLTVTNGQQFNTNSDRIECEMASSSTLTVTNWVWNGQQFNTNSDRIECEMASCLTLTVTELSVKWPAVQHLQWQNWAWNGQLFSTNSDKNLVVQYSRLVCTVKCWSILSLQPTKYWPRATNHLKWPPLLSIMTLIVAHNDHHCLEKQRCLFIMTLKRGQGCLIFTLLSGISGLSFDSPFPITSLVCLPSPLALSVVPFFR